MTNQLQLFIGYASFLSLYLCSSSFDVRYILPPEISVSPSLSVYSSPLPFSQMRRFCDVMAPFFFFSLGGFTLFVRKTLLVLLGLVFPKSPRGYTFPRTVLTRIHRHFSTLLFHPFISFFFLISNSSVCSVFRGRGILSSSGFFFFFLCFCFSSSRLR